MSIFQSLTSSISEYQVILATIAAATATASLTYKNFLESYDLFKRRKLKKLKDALDSEYVTGLTKERLLEDIETEYYRLATGISAEKSIREAMIKNHKSIASDVSYYHFLRARYHLGMKNGELTVNISWFDKLANCYNIATAIFFLFLAGLFLITPLASAQKTLSTTLNCIIIGFIFIGAFGFSLYQIRPIYSAQLIKKELQKLDKPK